MIERFMRALFIIVLIVAIMVLAGWLAIRFGENSATVEVRTEKIEQDTSEVIEKANETIKRAGEAIEETVERP